MEFAESVGHVTSNDWEHLGPVPDHRLGIADFITIILSLNGIGRKWYGV